MSFCELAVVTNVSTATHPSRRRSFDRPNYTPRKGETNPIKLDYSPAYLVVFYLILSPTQVSIDCS